MALILVDSPNGLPSNVWLIGKVPVDGNDLHPPTIPIDTTDTTHAAAIRSLYSIASMSMADVMPTTPQNIQWENLETGEKFLIFV